jgi:hypothetical protein
MGSTGVTVFNTFDGRNYGKTGTTELFKLLSRSGANWGVFEYNLSVPVRTDTPSTDMSYYMSELRTLYEYRPHVIVPFAWTDTPHLKTMNIQNTTFEAALKRFIADVGNVPWGARN